jgi:glycine/serine hydroxymethyltransferase
MISSHHFAATISLGIALHEFKECGGPQYAAGIVRNAKALGRYLYERGLGLDAADRDFSCGHQLWIRTSVCDVDAYVASDRLYQAGIRVNAFPELPGIKERVLRIGVNEATFHGLQVEDMSELAEIFVAAVLNRRAPNHLAGRVAEIRARYSHPFCFPSSDPRLLMRILDIVRQAMAPHDFSETEEVLASHVTARG